MWSGVLSSARVCSNDAAGSQSGTSGGQPEARRHQDDDVRDETAGGRADVIWRLAALNDVLPGWFKETNSCSGVQACVQEVGC